MRVPFLAFIIIWTGCQPSQHQQTAPPTEMADVPFDLQGHRGCQGLMPENSLPGFRHALEIGVTTLELDVVISADSQVVVSHEPWLSPEFCADTAGRRVNSDSEVRYNLFEMFYAEIRQYDCGSLPHPRFPKQQKLPTYKPLLREVLDSTESHARRLERPLPFYNVEIKRRPEWDDVFHPEVGTFVDLVLAEVKASRAKERIIIQSFDPKTLRLVRKADSTIPLALLIENERTPAENLATLGFVPEIYSPYFRLVDEELIRYASQNDMKVIPWTVDDPADMQALIARGVDGIITNYPDRVPMPSQ